MKILPVSVILVVLLVAASFLNSPIVQNSTAANSSRRFGFGFVDVGGLMTQGYTATQFYNGMFKTPPYPSTWMAGIIDNPGGNGSVFDPAGTSVQFLKTVMDDIVADGLNVKIVVMVGADISQQANVDAIVTLVNYLSSLPSRSVIGGFGWRVEQTGALSSGTTAAQWDSVFATVRVAVTSVGWPTINYYPQGYHGTATEARQEGWLDHTNFPQADPISTLDTLNINVAGASVTTIGITHGTDGPAYFNDVSGNMQSDLGCGLSGWPNWQNQPMSQGYLPSPAPPGAVPCAQNWPAIIDYTMSRDAANPVANRQWDFWIAGTNTNGYYNTVGSSGLHFTGASGKWTDALWDSPAFRGVMANWIAANPGKYVTSTGGVPPVTSTTSTSTSATSTSSTSTAETTTSTSTHTSTTSSTSHSSTTSTSTHTSTTSSTSHSETHISTSTTASATSTSTSSTSTAETTTSRQTSTTSSNPLSISLTLSQSGGTAPQGGVFSTVVQVLVQGALTQPLSLSSAGVPQGFNVTFSPYQAYSSFESTMSIQVSPTMGTGVYSFEVMASSGTLTRAVSFGLAIAAKPSQYVLQLSASPTEGGTTGPSPGRYEYAPGTSITVAALAAPDWVFDHWNLNGTFVGNSDLLTTTVNQNNTVLTAVFSYQPTSSNATASVVFLAQGYSGAPIEVDGSNYSLPAYFNWDLGSSHNITAFSLSRSVTHVDFLGWGNVQSSNTTTLHLVTNQSTYVLVNYREQVLTQLIFVDSAGRQLNPQNAILLGPSGGISVQSNQSVWLLPGARYSLLSAEVMGVEVAPSGASADVIVAGPSQIFTLPLLVYDAQVKVVDIFGMPLKNVLVSLTTIDGQSMNVTTDSSGEARFSDVPYGIYSAHVSYVGISYAIAQNSIGDIPVTLTLTFSYPLAVAVLVVANTSSFMVLRRIRRRRREDYLFR